MSTNPKSVNNERNWWEFWKIEACCAESLDAGTIGDHKRHSHKIWHRIKGDLSGTTALESFLQKMKEGEQEALLDLCYHSIEDGKSRLLLGKLTECFKLFEATFNCRIFYILC